MRKDWVLTRKGLGIHLERNYDDTWVGKVWWDGEDDFATNLDLPSRRAAWKWAASVANGVN